MWLAVIGPLVLGKLWVFFKAILDKTLTEELAAIMPIVADIVRQVDADPTILTVEARFQTVMLRALAAIAAAQMKVGMSVLYFAIGLAVRNLMVSQPSPAEARLMAGRWSSPKWT